MSVRYADQIRDKADGVRFEASGSVFTIRRRQAELLAENLRLFATGKFPRDVAEVVRLGVSHRWAKDGALAMAEVMEDVLAGRLGIPIPLGGGKGAEAMFGALSLITDVQPERDGAMGLRDALRAELLGS